MTQRQQVLRMLRGSHAPYSLSYLSLVLGVPKASIRRIIGELRADGYFIPNTGIGLYELHEFLHKQHVYAGPSAGRR
jgi:DNA-binding IclR family transcriptional regulator